MAPLRAFSLRRSSAAAVTRARDQARSARKALARFARPGAFGAPPDAEAGAVRAVRNARRFRAHYAAVLWVCLLCTLAPSRKATLFFLMAISKVAAFYLVLLRSFPNSWLLQRLLRRRLVISALVGVIGFRLVTNDCVRHFLLAMAIGVPLVFAHAIFRIGDDVHEKEHSEEASAAEEQPAVPKGEKEDGDVESQD